MIVSRQRLVLAAAAACLAAATLAGCAQKASDMDTGVAADLQSAAQNVRAEAAAGHYGQALQELADIERQANEAAAQGKLSAARKQDVLTAVALVRTDLETASGSHSTPSPSASTASSSPSTSESSKAKKKDEPKDSSKGQDQNN
ncbi:hypothetical protein [Sinomonas terrae]|uniref:DUF4398 domain-containing protein n=1 Tax=Sinomonas terrae TaxID=2908838 RepID=A0ABS9U7U7_9MICC|nr:hypothetical protein [Sinomonas terrae]MCH6472345.1 hypothetical protein [Sinomonas terrae]